MQGYITLTTSILHYHCEFDHVARFFDVVNDYPKSGWRITRISDDEAVAFQSIIQRQVVKYENIERFLAYSHDPTKLYKYIDLSDVKQHKRDEIYKKIRNKISEKNVEKALNKLQEYKLRDIRNLYAVLYNYKNYILNENNSYPLLTHNDLRQQILKCYKKEISNITTNDLLMLSKEGVLTPSELSRCYNLSYYKFDIHTDFFYDTLAKYVYSILTWLSDEMNCNNLLGLLGIDDDSLCGRKLVPERGTTMGKLVKTNMKRIIATIQEFTPEKSSELLIKSESDGRFYYNLYNKLMSVSNLQPFCVLLSDKANKIRDFCSLLHKMLYDVEYKNFIGTLTVDDCKAVYVEIYKEPSRCGISYCERPYCYKMSEFGSTDNNDPTRRCMMHRKRTDVRCKDEQGETKSRNLARK